MNYFHYLAIITISCLTIKNPVKRNPPKNRSIRLLNFPKFYTSQQGVRKRERTPYFPLTKRFPLSFPFNARAYYLPGQRSGGVEFLKKTHPNIYAIDEKMNTVLQLAIIHDRPFKEVKQFVEEFQIDIHHENISGETAFLLAAQKGNLELLQFLKEKGADVNTVDDLRKNALQWAIHKNHSLELIEWLIDAGVDMRGRGCFNNPPFIQAALAGNLLVLELLLKKGADVQIANDTKGNNALQEAILAFKTSEDMTMIKWLIEVAQVSIYHKNSKQETPFLLAAKKGNLELLQLLKEKGAKVNDIDPYNRSALNWALHYNHPVPVIKWLIDAGVVINGREIIDSDLFVCCWMPPHPFLQAAKKGNLPVLKLLLKNGANALVTDQEGENALYYAIRRRCNLGDEVSEDISMTEWLIDEAKLSVNSKKADGKTPFIYAAECDDLDILKCLLAKGADALMSNQKGENALYYAIRRRRHIYNQAREDISVPEWLIDKAKLSVNSKRADGKTLFMRAAEHGDLDMLKCLLAKGADAHTTDNRGNNALHYAIHSKSQPKVIEWLISTAEVDIEAKTADLETPFLCVAKQEKLANLNIFSYLLEKGADVHAKDRHGNNALILAMNMIQRERDIDINKIEWLIYMAKLSVNSKGSDGKTPFIYAAKLGCRDLLIMLKNKGADVHAKDNLGRNALWYAKNETTIQCLKEECGLRET